MNKSKGEISYKDYKCDGCTLLSTDHGLACNECYHATTKKVEYKKFIKGVNNEQNKY